MQWTRTVGIGLAAFGAVMALPASADTKATYIGDRPAGAPATWKTLTTTIYIDDAGNDRTDTFIGGKLLGTVIFRNDVAYVVERGQDGVVVMRQSDLIAASKGWLVGSCSDCQRFSSGGYTSYSVLTLGPETVNGRRGTRYALRGPDERGEVFSEIVIADDAGLSNLGRVTLRQMASAQRSIGDVFPDRSDMTEKVGEILSKGAILRYGKSMRLDRVETGPIDPKLFDLPGPVLTLDQIRARLNPPALKMPAKR
jgi:hypothetical protein